MKWVLLLSAAIMVLFSSCALKRNTAQIDRKEVQRIIAALSADEMQGRKIFTPGVEKAAQFIEAEFKAIGLEPMSGLSGYRQSFQLTDIAPGLPSVSVDGATIETARVIVLSSKPHLQWDESSAIDVLTIKGGESFISQYRNILANKKDALVLVDEQFVDAFNRLRDHFMNDRISEDEAKPSNDLVFVLALDRKPKSFQISFSSPVERTTLSNIVGIIPGRSKPNEYVIFSGHYDHIGIVEGAGADSIANGADDNASGIAAVLSLARHYKQQHANERTLVFAAFTAEEIGMVGSQHFSEKVNAKDVVAMFNIEMIGKESKFGTNTAYITGYELSDLGQLLQQNLGESGFKFLPDPYPMQGLFYRSDNAGLAEKGVPAHTISTVQIDNDKYYHTVSDELQTLNLDNVVATINAIARGAKGIVSGAETPRRILVNDK